MLAAPCFIHKMKPTAPVEKKTACSSFVASDTEYKTMKAFEGYSRCLMQ